MRISCVRCSSSVLVAVCALVLFGCSYTVTPGIVPPVREQGALSLSGVSVLVRSAEKASAESPIPTDTGSSSGFLASRQAWARKLVESLAGELARRGARVSPKAALTIDISLPAITFIPGRDRYRLDVRATAALSTGWTRDYHGSASVPVTSVASSQEVDRMAGRALSGIVREMLTDPEFPARIGK